MKFHRDRETSLLKFQPSQILRHMAWENFHFEKMKILPTFVLESLQKGWRCINFNVTKELGARRDPYLSNSETKKITSIDKGFYKCTFEMFFFIFNVIRVPKSQITKK